MENLRSSSAIIVSGGVAHDFPASSAELARVLGEAGFAATVTTDVDGTFADLQERSPGLLVLNLLRWTMQVERYARFRDEWSISLSDKAREGLAGYVRGGGGLLALHGASICFDDWPAWGELLGGAWRWDVSHHPPLGGPVRVTVSTDAHPVVVGVRDFSVVDEVYGFLDLADDVVPLMTSPHSGADHPLLWARSVGAGRVVYDALGHDTRSYQAAEHRGLVRSSARWAAGAG